MSCPVRNAAARQNTIPGRKKATSHASRPPSRSIPVKPSTDIAALWATTSAQCPRSGAARAGWRVRQPHPHLLAHEFQILASNGASQPALWPVLPALAGTGGHHAGQISQRRLPDTSPFGHEVLFAGFPDGGQAGPTRRLTEPTAPVRALPADWRGPPTSPAPASSCISNDWIYLGVFWLAGGFWVPGCTKNAPEPKSSRHRAPQDARALRHTGTCPAGG
jgi:hypothetical protein